MLKNENISSVFKDAMNAPMGSTKREKARRMASVLNKTMTRYDGKGGPGYPQPMAPLQPMQPMPQPEGPVPGLVIFKAPPSPSAAGGMPDGQGGPGVDLSRLSLGAGLGAPAAGFNPTAGFSLTQPSAPAQSNPSSLLTGMPKMTNVVGFQPNNQMTGFSPVDPSRLSFSGLGTPSSYQFNQPAAAQPGAAPKPALTPAPTPAPQAGGTTPVPELPTPEIPTPLMPEVPVQEGDASSVGSSYQGLTSALDNALGSATGPSTFAYQSMNDINALRELFPGVPDDQLPVGASLSGQIDALRKSLRNEYDIDATTADLTQKIQDGVTLEQDLKDYVRGKDEYLNEIDSMLTDAKRTAIAKSGGPDAGMFGSYIDYLTVLKGRQNKRYIDFYNDSIGVYQKELDSLQSKLQTETDGFTKELETMATLKQEDYNRIFTSLTEMYNAAEAAPTKQLELQILLAEAAKASGDSALTAASGVNTDWISEFGNLKTKGIIINSETGTLLPQVSSLESALESIVSNGKTDIGGAYRILGEAISNDLGSSGEDLTAYFSKVKKYEKMLTDLKAQAQTEEIMNKYGYDMTPAIDSLAQTLASRTSEAVSQSVSNDASNMRKIMKDLAGGSGWFGLGAAPDRVTFIKKHGGKNMPDDLLGKLFDYAAAIKSADPTGSSLKALTALPDDQFSSAISHGLGVSLFGGVLNS